jgi:trigger factor
VKTTVEPLGGNKVKLSVEVAQDEVDAAVDAAFRKIAQHVRVPGFRPGKAPRRLLEARVGMTTARHEALTDSLPEFYAKALEQAELQPIAPPEIDITAGRDEGPVSFDAVVEVMPQIAVAGYEGLRVVVGNFDVEEALIDAQIDRLRQQYGELRSVARPARDGDHVSIDRKTSRHSEVLAAVDDELYEVGCKVHGPELDEHLQGARAGDILKFNAQHDEDREVTFTVLVKDVREKAQGAQK